MEASASGAIWVLDAAIDVEIRDKIHRNVLDIVNRERRTEPKQLFASL
jgi:hypothetical protein